MNYRPNQNNLSLWDTWMFNDPDDRRMHLFFLASKPDSNWEWVGHAISDDLVHWQELPEIHARFPEDTYDVGCIGTGMVFQAPSGEYMMSYTTNLDGAAQRIAFLHSKDLMNWEKRWQEPVFGADPEYYETDAAKCITSPPAFRDAFVFKIDDHYEALIGAHAKDGLPLLRGCIARYKSCGDELKNWIAMPPIIGPDVSALMEVPEHFQVGDKHYLLWSNISIFGAIHDTPSRRFCNGTFYAMADNYDGPYSVPENNLLIGAGGFPQSYVGRTMMWGGERILYHHMFGPQPSYAFPKRIIQNSDGTLQLGYWPGLEAAHANHVDLELDNLQMTGENFNPASWTSNKPGSLTGKLLGGGSAALVSGEYEDVHIRCNVTSNSCTRFGVILRDTGEKSDAFSGSILDADRVKQALKSIYKFNFKRGTGLINGSCPPNIDKRFPTYGSLQAGSNWTGIEYMTAALMVEHGLIDEAYAIVHDIDRRHFRAGRAWNHEECGAHYYRAMASWSIMIALSGFRYNALTGHLQFTPKKAGEYPFFVPGACGLCRTTENGVEIEVKAGSLRCNSFDLGNAAICNCAVELPVVLNAGDTFFLPQSK